MITNNILPNGLGIMCNAALTNTGIAYYLPKNVENKLLGKKINVVFSSYPIMKNDKFYDIKMTLDFTETDYVELFRDIVCPIVERLKTEYDAMVAVTKQIDIPMLLNTCRANEEYCCLHSFEDLFVEVLQYDSKTNTMSVFIGS